MHDLRYELSAASPSRFWFQSLAIAVFSHFLDLKKLYSPLKVMKAGRYESQRQSHSLTAMQTVFIITKQFGVFIHFTLLFGWHYISCHSELAYLSVTQTIPDTWTHASLSAINQFINSSLFVNHTCFKSNTALTWCRQPLLKAAFIILFVQCARVCQLLLPRFIARGPNASAWP